MTSDAKLKANRANARASTGPKSAAGRARSAKNALRHALSVPVSRNPVLCAEVEVLAREIAGPDANDEIRERACQFAEAQIDLCRIRSARLQLLSRALADPEYYSRVNDRKISALLPRHLREDILLAADFVEPKTTGPEGLEKLAMILAQEAKQLLAMHRYERRALSRRKFAIRALDDARRLDDADSGAIATALKVVGVGARGGGDLGPERRAGLAGGRPMAAPDAASRASQ